MVSDYVSDQIIENMDIPTNIKSIEEHLIRGGVFGAASSGVMLASGLPMSNVPAAFVLGGGSKLAGDIVFDKLFGARGMIGPIF